MKKSTVIWVCLLALCGGCFLIPIGPRAKEHHVTERADCDAFLKASDGEVIGILGIGKTNLSITGTIKEVTWTSHDGKSVVLRWDGKTLQRDGIVIDDSSLFSSGKYCQSNGHHWEPGCGVSGCLVNHVGPMRHCIICGQVQTQELGPWK